jgi:hypothetical protein
MRRLNQLILALCSDWTTGCLSWPAGCCIIHFIIDMWTLLETSSATDLLPDRNSRNIFRVRSFHYHRQFIKSNAEIELHIQLRKNRRFVVNAVLISYFGSFDSDIEKYHSLGYIIIVRFTLQPPYPANKIHCINWRGC